MVICCKKTEKKKENPPTFRHIWPPQRTGDRFAAKRAFILSTHRKTIDYLNTFYIEKRDTENYLLFLRLIIILRK